jgi:Cu+-exporting ATPase
MKKIFLMFILLGSLISCKNNEQNHPDNNPKPALRADAKFVTTTFKVEGMHCEKGCAATLQKKIFNLEGVKTSEIDFKNKSAKIVFDQNVMTTEKIVEKVIATDKNYVVSEIKTN